MSSTEPLIYETHDWDDDQRMSFENLLKWAQVNFSWENDGSLSVDPKDEAAVDQLLDQFTSGDLELPEGAAAAAGYVSTATNSDADAESDADSEAEAEQEDEEDAEAAEDDGEFDAAFTALVKLFESADVLSRDIIDEGNRTAFIHAANTIGEQDPPYGWDDALWDYVCERSALLAAGIEDAIDADAIEIDTRALKDVIVRYM